MRAPSLYTHFESKNAIYDAMFGQAWRDYEQVAVAELGRTPAGSPGGDPPSCARVLRVRRRQPCPPPAHEPAHDSRF